MIAALGSTSAVEQVTASTVDMAAISTLHSNKVARNTDPPTLPTPALTGRGAVMAAGGLVAAGSEELTPDGLLVGDRGPTLDKLTPPTDDIEF